MDFVGGSLDGQSDGGAYLDPPEVLTRLRMRHLPDGSSEHVPGQRDIYHRDTTSWRLPFWRHESLDTPGKLAAALEAHENRPVRRMGESEAEFRARAPRVHSRG